jgi:hypothetical protein
MSTNTKHMPHKSKTPKTSGTKIVKHAILKHTIKKGELEAFSKGQFYDDMVTEEKETQAHKVTVDFLGSKKMAKKEVFGKFTKDANKIEARTPLVVVFATDLNGEKELLPRKKLFELLEGLMVLNIKILVIDTEQRSDLNNLGELPEHYQEHLIWYNPKQDNSGRNREGKEIDRLFLAADLAILFNSQHELIELLMSYGVVPIGEERSPLLENYRPNEETGNAFLFNKKDLWSVFAATVRALETYKFPYDWNHIVRKLYK